MGKCLSTKLPATCRHSAASVFILARTRLRANPASTTTSTMKEPAKIIKMFSFGVDPD
jgi:hypothetical protein